MKRILALIVVLSAVAAGPASAGKNTEGFGLGLMAGEPNGLSAKIWTGKRTAFDAGLGWSTKDGAGVAAHVDYLWHVHDMRRTDRGILPFYYGIGIRYRDQEDQDDNFGVRIPLGLNYLFGSSAFDVFFEVAPVIDFTPEQKFGANVVVGGRYFF
jgi:hypothetical protein